MPTLIYVLIWIDAYYPYCTKLNSEILLHSYLPYVNILIKSVGHSDMTPEAELSGLP